MFYIIEFSKLFHLTKTRTKFVKKTLFEKFSRAYLKYFLAIFSQLNTLQYTFLCSETNNLSTKLPMFKSNTEIEFRLESIHCEFPYQFITCLRAERNIDGG